MATPFQVFGTSSTAPFVLKLHRGEGMVLIAMDWKAGRPPDDFVGFAIDYKPPGEATFFVVSNRLSFDDSSGLSSAARPRRFQSTVSPIQKFRWVHFPFQPSLTGAFTYRVTPMSMAPDGKLVKGVAQTAKITLGDETYPGKLNIAFTRGFVSSQAFVDRYLDDGSIATLLPEKADDGLSFVPTHPRAADARDWMGFEARRMVLGVLDAAVADPTAQVGLVAYDLNQPELVTRLEALGARLRVIIDDSDPHGEAHSAETQAAARLVASAGASNVKRQHMGNLQHNKMIVIDGAAAKHAIGGSTNFSWRGMFVQSNNAVILTGSAAIQPFVAAFDAYWNRARDFRGQTPTRLVPLGLAGIDAQVTFSPHGDDTLRLPEMAGAIDGATSSFFYSLAFLSQTGGLVTTAVEAATNRVDLFTYGMSDKRKGIVLVRPDGNPEPVFAEALTGNVPEPFRSEPTGLAGGVGTRMHHKFLVIDFDTPNACVYTGSHNCSRPADRDNGENLLVLRDRRIATSYMIEALRIFDHYSFRVARKKAADTGTPLTLRRPPSAPGELPWFDREYSEPTRVRDRQLFARVSPP